jgi:hypothetical protein
VIVMIVIVINIRIPCEQSAKLASFAYREIVDEERGLSYSRIVVKFRSSRKEYFFN